VVKVDFVDLVVVPRGGGVVTGTMVVTSDKPTAGVRGIDIKLLCKGAVDACVDASGWALRLTFADDGSVCAHYRVARQALGHVLQVCSN
jgi:hypothetical protein